MNTVAKPGDRIGQTITRCDERIEGQTQVQSHAPQTTNHAAHGLIECRDYEWTRPISMPGLVAIPKVQAITETITRAALRNHSDEILDTEDGDALNPSQLPGGLSIQNAALMSEMFVPQSASEADVIDEYLESAAMQFPGRLKDARSS